MSDIRRVRVVASGAVQGVFFRASTEEEAERLGLTGWVRNRSDGRVEAEFQGPPGTVDEAIDFCRGGPGAADVRELEVDEVDPVPHETGFSAR